MKKITLVIFLLAFTLLSFAQNEASTWYFGRLAGLDFKNGPPMLLRDGQILTNEGCSTISDDNGNLLFYTNGAKVWNKNHEIMTNGEDLFGHWSSTNSSIIIPKPNSTNIYYLITIDEPSHTNAEFYPNPNPNPITIDPFDVTSDSDDGLNNGLNYSVVDMALQNGLGQVISKNNHLVTYDASEAEQLKYKCSEKLTAIYNSDGTEVWFLTHFIDKFYAFKVNENGIETNPIISESGYSIPTSGFTLNGIGCIKFSPNGKKLALANLSNGTETPSGNVNGPRPIGNAYLFDFDNSTGIVSNGLQLLNEGNPYGVEFSPDSRVLYLNVNEYDSFSSDLFQFDLTATDVVGSKYRAWGATGSGALQLGIDGVIYISMPNSWFLSRVTNPNTYGTDVNVTWYDVNLDGFDPPYRQAVFGLPNYIQNFFEQNITFDKLCFGEETTLKLINYTDVNSVHWNFGDSDSGSLNESTELEPTHVYSSLGAYEVTAVILYDDGSEKIITRELEITGIPIANPIEDIHVCAEPNSSYSNWTSSFPAGHVLSEVLQGQENMRVTFNEGISAAFGDPISELGNNSVFTQETITVRVAQKNNPTCYDETTFMVIVDDGAFAYPVEDIYACDSDNNGYAEFDLSSVEDMVTGNQTDVEVTFHDENNNLIELSNSETYINTTPFSQTLTARITDLNFQCIQEVSFNLITETMPIAYALQNVFGCDDNNDGISEYFDTSNITQEVVGNQTNMAVTFYDSGGRLLPSPLPHPYTNTTPNQEIITVRVTNLLTTCFAETPLVLNTASQPQIQTPPPFYACDTGNGYGSFDTSTFEAAIIGNQNGLTVQYFNADGTALPSPLPNTFQNKEAWRQTIYVTVANELNSLCTNETSFDLVVNELPQVAIEASYFLCNLEPSLNLTIPADFDTYVWVYQNNTTVSTTNDANLVSAGKYMLTVGETINGIYCENSFEFELVRSILPTIAEIELKELSDNNFIEIIAEGDGDFEYAIDGENYQDSNRFDEVLGGVYNASVRDKNGCGEATQEIVLIDYPKFFTPNNDGKNDYWQIYGVEQFQDSNIYIYDRYGKLLTQLSPNDIGWDGLFNGKPMISNDYWFKALLGNRIMFSGHFTLKR